MEHGRALAFARVANSLALLKGEPLYRVRDAPKSEPKPVAVLLLASEDAIRPLFKDWEAGEYWKWPEDSEEIARTRALLPDGVTLHMHDSDSHDSLWRLHVRGIEGEYKVELSGMVAVRKKLETITRTKHRIYKKKSYAGRAIQGNAEYQHNLAQARKHLPKLAKKIEKNWTETN